jgi:hypothetical protein
MPGTGARGFPLWAGRLESDSRYGHRFSSLRHRVQPAPGPIQWVQEAISPRTKRPVLETGHSSSSTEVKKAWGYTFTSPYVFMAW